MADEAAVREAAKAYLRQRGFENAADGLTTRPRDIKLNDMLMRERSENAQDTGRPMRRFALHVDPKVGPGYEESYARLDECIRSRPMDEQQELSLLRFPKYVHCFWRWLSGAVPAMTQ